jgi:hypothetical protein
VRGQSRIVGHRAFRLPRRLRLPGDSLVLLDGGEVYPAAAGVGHDRHEAHAHPACLALLFDVVVLDWSPVSRQRNVARPSLRPRLHRRAVGRCAGAHAETPRARCPVHHRFQPGLAPLLARKPEGAHERDGRPARCGVRARHRPRPDPGDDRKLLAHIGLEMRVLGGHLRRHLHGRVEVPDLPPRLLQDHPPVVAHISGQTRRPAPALLSADPSPVLRVHGRVVGPTGHQLEVALAKQYGHRVDVPGVGLHPEPRCLQRNRAPSGEGVEQGRELPVTVLEHLRPCLGVDLRVLVELGCIILRMIPKSRSRSLSWASSVGNFSGWLEGSSTTEAKSTARLTGSGSRAHQWWIPLGCAPMPGILSYAEASLISARGRATWISFLRLLFIARLRLCDLPVAQRPRWHRASL